MNLEWLASKVDRLEQALGNRVMAIAEWTTLSRTTAVGDKDQANVAANPNDRQRPVRRAAPWGVAGYPPAGVFALVVKAVAGVFNGVYPGIATDKYGPQNLSEGETSLYCSANGTRVYLDKNGAIHVDASSGQDVVVNGGSAKVGRVGDTVDGGTLSTVIGQTGPAVTVTVNWIPPGGGSPTPVFAFSATGTGTPGTYVVPLIGKISAGAANFKG